MSSVEATGCAGPTRLLDQVRERVRYLHYSLRTEQAYVHWVRVFVRFHGLRHPKTLGGPEVESFLSWRLGRYSVLASAHRHLRERPQTLRSPLYALQAA